MFLAAYRGRNVPGQRQQHQNGRMTDREIPVSVRNVFLCIRGSTMGEVPFCHFGPHVQLFTSRRRSEMVECVNKLYIEDFC